MDQSAASSHPLHTAVLQKAFVPTAVFVAHAAGNHVGHGLKAAMWVIWKAGNVVARVVAAEGIEHQKWVKALLQVVAEYTCQTHTRTI